MANWLHLYNCIVTALSSFCSDVEAIIRKWTDHGLITFDCSSHQKKTIFYLSPLLKVKSATFDPGFRNELEQWQKHDMEYWSSSDWDWCFIWHLYQLGELTSVAKQFLTKNFLELWTSPTMNRRWHVSPQQEVRYLWLMPKEAAILWVVRFKVWVINAPHTTLSISPPPLGLASDTDRLSKKSPH